ncbi:hypothetical protein [Paraburkholderia sp. UCT70]|uniref:hypothetical protein n=1 Tax=Paraburkholderia sp. UCT70 TaxID=2991068 RepID=UPI003D1A589A
MGAIAVIVWYWSRKKVEVELESLAPDAWSDPSTHAYSWAVGWFPWQWDAYKVLDLVLPAISSGLIAVAMRWYCAPL